METVFHQPITGMGIASYPCSYRDGSEQIVLGKKHRIKRNGKTNRENYEAPDGTEKQKNPPTKPKLKEDSIK